MHLHSVRKEHSYLMSFFFRDKNPIPRRGFTNFMQPHVSRNYHFTGGPSHFSPFKPPQSMEDLPQRWNVHSSYINGKIISMFMLIAGMSYLGLRSESFGVEKEMSRWWVWVHFFVVFLVDTYYKMIYTWYCNRLALDCTTQLTQAWVLIGRMNNTR